MPQLSELEDASQGHFLNCEKRTRGTSFYQLSAAPSQTGPAHLMTCAAPAELPTKPPAQHRTPQRDPYRCVASPAYGCLNDAGLVSSVVHLHSRHTHREVTQCEVLLCRTEQPNNVSTAMSAQHSNRTGTARHSTTQAGCRPRMR